LRLDYVELRGPDELEAIEDSAEVGERALLAVAAFAGSTRLIDNVVLGEDPAPEGALA
jgi:pantoate--beta-alanine ligase